MNDSRGRADAADDAEVDEDDPPAVELASLAVLGAGLAALFLGYSWFWVVFVIGFAVVVPMVSVLANALGSDADAGAARRTEYETRDAPESKQDALDTLRDRYARGDLSDEEFERKVERLLETETPESAREHVERSSETARETEGESGRETDREPE